MRLEPHLLVTFALIAREGSVSRAAEHLFLTQPAVSTQLAKLTTAVGEPLFTRHRLGLRLTPAGEELLPHAQAVTRALQGAETAAQQLRGLEVGSLRVAASTTIASYLLPRVLAGFRQAHPSLRVELTAGNTQEVMQRLAHGECELALVEGPASVETPEWQQDVFAQDELVLVTLPDHPLAGTRPRREQLQDLPVVWREAGSGTRAVTEEALQDVRLRHVIELAGTEAVKEAVLLGLGVAFLSRLTVEREVQAGLLAATSVATPGLTRPLTCLHPQRRLLSRPSRAFLDALLELR